MTHYFEFRPTEDQIEDLRDHTRDESLIDAYAEWVDRADELDFLIRKIESAFADMPLGDGTGLLESKGLDDYATESEQNELRSLDEHNDWRLIDVETLNRCNAAPSFMNARGFIFHLPAFLIAELNDRHEYGFIDRLFDTKPLVRWKCLLNRAQRDAIIDTLSLVAQHPSFRDSSDDIAMAITQLQADAG